MHKSDKMKDTCASKIIPIQIIVHSSAMHYQNLIIIHECSKKLLKMKNSKSFFLTPSIYTLFEKCAFYQGPMEDHLLVSVLYLV